MSRVIFTFIASLLLLLPVVFNAGSIHVSVQMIICTPFILFLGIPHGAIDNVLYLRNNRIKNPEFIGTYLVFVSLNVLLWVTLPHLAYPLFLILSAYHFGQSQFTHYFNRPFLIYKALYTLWGIAILSALIYLNMGEIQQIIQQEEEFASFSAIHQELLLLSILTSSCLGTLLLLAYLTLKKVMSFETLFMEILVLALIILCFYLMPLLVGFTLYFVILHSLKVLREEYNFLSSEKEIGSVGNLIKLLAPFTLLSFAGIALLFGLIYLDVLSLSYGYCLLIVISSITLPHVIVMNKFYQRLFNRNIKGKLL